MKAAEAAPREEWEGENCETVFAAPSPPPSYSSSAQKTDSYAGYEGVPCMEDPLKLVLPRAN